MAYRTHARARIQLRGHAALFWAAAAFLIASLLARVWFGLQERKRVDWEQHRWLYWGGLLLSVVEPFLGGRIVKRAFQSAGTSGGAQRWDIAQKKWVVDDRDPLAVQATNDAAAARAEAKTSVVLVVAEDVPGFVIQVLFVLDTGGRGGVAALGDPVLLLTAFTTVVHAVKQLTEAWQLWRHELPELEREDRARDKAFAEDAVDGDVLAFAEQAGAGHARKVSLHGCGNITDAAAQVLARRCPGLTYIDLYCCTNITDAAVEVLAMHCTNICTIGLKGCTRITDTAIGALARHCTGMTGLNVANCSGITDAAVRAVALRCRDITIINLADCTKLTDSAVQVLAEHCAGITWIVLRNCEHMTDAAVLALAQHCTDINYVSLAGCSSITDAAVQALKARQPDATVIR